MGKGSGPRQGIFDRPFGPGSSKEPGLYDNRSPQEKYEDNWEKVFGKKKFQGPDGEYNTPEEAHQAFEKIKNGAR